MPAKAGHPNPTPGECSRGIAVWARARNQPHRADGHGNRWHILYLLIGEGDIFLDRLLTSYDFNPNGPSSPLITRFTAAELLALLNARTIRSGIGGGRGRPASTSDDVQQDKQAATLSPAAQHRRGIPSSQQARQGRVNIAEGSVEECRYFLILANDLGYGDTAALAATLEEVSRLLNAYVAAILTPDSWLLTSISRLHSPQRWKKSVDYSTRTSPPFWLLAPDS